jgi:hypothetical protein
MTTSDYGDLSTTALAKLITDEYSLILASERTNLQKALAIGEKLVALRQRVKHGEWETKLQEYCPTISYETATKYIRLYENWEKIKEAAKAKGVATTDLTIEAALKLIAKPKTNADKPKDTSKGKPTSVGKGAVEEPGNEPQPRSIAPDVALDGLANDEMFHTLQNVYENRQEEFLDLVGMLAQHFGMMLVPSAAIKEAMGTAA